MYIDIYIYMVPLKGLAGDIRQVKSCCYDQIGI